MTTATKIDRCHGCGGGGLVHPWITDSNGYNGHFGPTYPCRCEAGRRIAVERFVKSLPARVAQWLEEPPLRETPVQCGIADRLEDWIDTADYSLYVWGGPGRGKTVMVTAAVRRMLAEGFTKSAVFVKPIDLLARLRSTFNHRDGESTEAVMREYVNIGLLLLDDLGTEVQRQESAWAAEQIYSILDQRYDANRLLAITSNFGPRHLARHLGGSYGPRFISRLQEMTDGGRYALNCEKLPDLRARRSSAA